MIRIKTYDQDNGKFLFVMERNQETLFNLPPCLADKKGVEYLLRKYKRDVRRYFHIASKHPRPCHKELRAAYVQKAKTYHAYCKTLERVLVVLNQDGSKSPFCVSTPNQQEPSWVWDRMNRDV